ncbi:MAG: helix-turn-helix transcriptional regulator [Oscillospiraceae bacterium]|nr:helix-turn-helix transcriptional regulator [Oscillospiraceae bacterium]
MDFKLQAFKVPMRVSSLANIHYFEFTNEYHTEENYHDFCEFLFVDSGSITVNSENYKGNLFVNQFIIHRPNERHSLVGFGSTAPNVIIIGFECKSPELAQFSKQPTTLTPEHKRMLSKIMQEGMSIYEPPYDIPNTTYMKKRREYPFGADQMIKISLEAFLISLVRDFGKHENHNISNSEAQDAHIQSVHQYITEHFSEKIALDSLCFLFGTNKSSLCHNFKTAYGMTILEYIHYLRIKEAKRLLREKNMSVTQISEVLGFESVHYFCRLFRKYTRLTPTQYEKSVKSKLSL